MPNSKSVISDLYTSLLYPIKALISKNFYFTVLFRMRGAGLVYLLFLSVGLAFFAGIKGYMVLENMSKLELPRLVAQMPPSYLNANGVLSPNDSSESYKLLRNSAGLPAVVYNTENRPLEGDALEAPLEFNSDAVSVKSGNNVETIPYSSIFNTDANFDPFLSSEALDMVMNASFVSVWAILAAWFFSALVFNTLICAFLGKFLMLMIYKIRTGFASIFRLSAFANTLVGVLMLLQFFVNIPLSYGIMALLPLIYILIFAREFRKELAASGMEAFKKKYARGGTFKGEAAGAGAHGRAASMPHNLHPENQEEKHSPQDGSSQEPPVQQSFDQKAGGWERPEVHESDSQKSGDTAPETRDNAAQSARNSAAASNAAQDSASSSDSASTSGASQSSGQTESEQGKIGHHRPGSFEA